jgi:hypothetical protein
MSSLVAQIDAGLSYAATLVDRPEIDYESVVVYSSWAVTAFELYILYVFIRTGIMNLLIPDLSALRPELTIQSSSDPDVRAQDPSERAKG